MRLRWRHSPATRNWFVASAPAGSVPASPQDNIYVWQTQGGWWVSSNTPEAKHESAREAMRAAQQAYSRLLMDIAHHALHKTTDA